VTGGQRRAGLLSDAELERSAVVANCAMNRERQLAGVNSYARELGFSPLGFLWSRLAGRPEPARAGWLDLCCGTGRALIQAAAQLPGPGSPDGPP
jgi:tRNA G46 methylase TrmB